MSISLENNKTSNEKINVWLETVAKKHYDDNPYDKNECCEVFGK